MKRRALFWLGLAARLAAAAAARLRGRLMQDRPEPALLNGEGKRIVLEGDDPTKAVLRDARLKGADFEVEGQFAGPERFTVNPIHLKALYAYREGKRLEVTYWCPVCSIRTYSPGICVCCQNETQLDLRDPARKDADPTA